MMSHDRHNHRIATQQPGLAADVCGVRDIRLIDRQDIETNESDFVHGLTGTGKLLHFRRMPPQLAGDPLDGPAKALAGLDGHEPVYDFREDRR